ncbi:beta-N-acetylhexosaminidase family protein [Flindersiella endophytica]
MTDVRIAHHSDASARVRHGVDLLAQALREQGLEVGSADPPAGPGDRPEGPTVYVGSRSSSTLVAELEQAEVLLYTTPEPGADGFYLSSLPGGLTVVTGGNDTGVLYGCQELARQVRRAGGLPRDLDHGETPDLALRGPAIGLQKTTVEPPRQTYEYPITPDRFPWFYDREHWLSLLETLLEQRANVVYLWSGHPFASFVRLDEYPEAQEVTDEELALNREVLHWLTIEADRRGIWVVLKFYNIHIPLPFAEYHGIPLRQPKPTPLVAAYTRAAIAAFVAEYTAIGLYVCLGEALQADIYGADWFADVILAGVSDAVAAAGLAEPPPVIVRNHAVDLRPVLEKALPRYPRLFTEAKYNGESLTTRSPRGKWQATHRFLASQGSAHIVNVHILANLEPFRYGAVSFVQRCAQAIKHRLGAGGLHLYPLFYWEWPYSPDRAEPRLRQLDRDWIWYEAWHRYAWQADRPPEAERAYWVDRLAARFGGARAGAAALDAYEAMGRIAPQLVRRFGITEGNRQTLSLGMLMAQLTNAARFRPWADLWDSHAPQGERLELYVAREIAGEPHVGETPLDVIADVRRLADEASAAIARGADGVSANAPEYERLRTDVEALALLARFYAERVSAAVDIMTYRETGHGDLGLLRAAVAKVSASVEAYRELADLTDRTYHYANSMQTPQRKVPFPDGSAYRHWRQCLPEYEAELSNLRRNVSLLERGELPPALRAVDGRPEPYQAAEFELHTPSAETFTVRKGTSVFADSDGNIRRLAEELDGLRGVRIPRRAGYAGEVALEISLPAPATILVGYFNDPEPVWLQVPDLETDTHADARGGLEPVLRNAIGVDFLPPVDIHAFRYEAGHHTLTLGRGAYVLAGVVAANQLLPPRVVVHAETTADTLDWLYEDPEE